MHARPYFYARLHRADPARTDGGEAGVARARFPCDPVSLLAPASACLLWATGAAGPAAWSSANLEPRLRVTLRTPPLDSLESGEPCWSEFSAPLSSSEEPPAAVSSPILPAVLGVGDRRLPRFPPPPSPLRLVLVSPSPGETRSLPSCSAAVALPPLPGDLLARLARPPALDISGDMAQPRRRAAAVAIVDSPPSPNLLGSRPAEPPTTTSSATVLVV